MDRHILIADFAKAVERLTDVLSAPARSDLEKAGCIQYFEFCFELAWKSVRLAAENQGLGDCSSPKSSLKQAFALNWIDNEEVWLEMLSARNRMSHTYNSEDALNVYDRLQAFAQELKKLLAVLQDSIQPDDNHS